MTTHIEVAPGTIASLGPAHGVDRWPSLFLVLFLPFGISSGYVSVTLAFLLGRAGLSTIAITTIIAASIWPQTWKVLWAPLVDSIGNPKYWYGLGTVLVGISLLAMSMLPANAHDLALLTGLAVLSSVASTLVSMAAEIFMTQAVPADRRGRASGWAQAGNMGGSGVGGGIGLVLAEHVAQPWVSGAVLAAICFLCWASVLLVPQVRRRGALTNPFASLVGIARDVWTVARSRRGYLALVIMLLPLAEGAAPWPAIAGEWHANADLVALVIGAGGGVVTGLGAVAGGYVCDRLDAKLCYCLFGLACGVITVTMAWAPRSPTGFAVFTLAYAVFVGCGYAAYSAVVLQAIGRKSAATNFTLMSALSNVPIAVMTDFDGWVHDRFGTNAMLYGELALPAATIAVFALFVFATRPAAPRLSQAEPANRFGPSR